MPIMNRWPTDWRPLATSFSPADDPALGWEHTVVELGRSYCRDSLMSSRLASGAATRGRKGTGSLNRQSLLSDWYQAVGSKVDSSGHWSTGSWMPL